MIVWFLALLFFVLMVFNLVGFFLSGPRYKGAVSDHFDGKIFLNPGNAKAKGLKDVIKWSVNRQREPWKNQAFDQVGPKPSIKITDGIKLTFINHSTFLIQVDGLNILSDPIWSERTSPFQFAGPKRMRAPGISFDDLPPIDLVLLSHNHYDHLDVSTMKELINIHDPQIITPLGVGTFIGNIGSTRYKDLDWWDCKVLNDDIKVSSVPAQHFSGRGTYDRDATLWCGYVISSSQGNIYFAGDSGYGDFFRKIGNVHEKMKVSMIPIGAYMPRWFMSPIHISPDEAVLVHEDVNSELSIGMHFGTFPLADDGRDQPIDDLRKALSNHDISNEKFLVLPEGDSLYLK